MYMYNTSDLNWALDSMSISNTNTAYNGVLVQCITTPMVANGSKSCGIHWYQTHSSSFVCVKNRLVGLLLL